jgi:hypothetical protein
MRPLKACLALVVAALTLTGCMKLEMDITIGADDDTVSGSLIYAVDKEVLKQVPGTTPRQVINDVLPKLKAMPAGTRSEPYEDTKYLGHKVIFERMPLAEFNRKDGTGPRIVHSGGLYTFTLNGDTATMDLGPDLAYYDILNNTEVRISVAFPGRVIERDNLATLDGQTVSWRVKMGSKHQFKAVSEGPSTFPWPLVAGVSALFGILAVVGIIALVIRLNRRPRPASEPMLTPAVQHVD